MSRVYSCTGSWLGMQPYREQVLHLYGVQVRRKFLFYSNIIIITVWHKFLLDCHGEPNNNPFLLNNTVEHKGIVGTCREIYFLNQNLFGQIQKNIHRIGYFLVSDGIVCGFWYLQGVLLAIFRTVCIFS